MHYYDQLYAADFSILIHSMVNDFPIFPLMQTNPFEKKEFDFFRKCKLPKKCLDGSLKSFAPEMVHSGSVKHVMFGKTAILDLHPAWHVEPLVGPITGAKL